MAPQRPRRQRVALHYRYWHFPLFSSSKHGNTEQMREFWRILYDAGADVVLSAHDHVYERFALQDADGNVDV